MAVIRYRGVPIDWLKPVLPCLQHVLDRAREEIWFGTPVRVASVEGLLVLKMLACRGQDVIDVQNLLAAHRGQIDLPFVRQDLRDALPESDDRLGRFDELVRDYYDVREN